MRIDAWTLVVVYRIRWFAGTQFCRKKSKDCFYRDEAQEKTISLHQGSSYRSTPNKDEFSADAHRK